MRFVTSTVAALLFASICGAQVRDTGFTFKVGGGYTPTVGLTKNRFDPGWNVLAGAGYNFHRHFGILGEFQYNNLGVPQRVLDNFGTPTGDAYIWSATLQPVVNLTSSESRVGVYVTAGGGFYRRNINFTEPSTAVGTFFDPWYGYYNAAYPTSRILGQARQDAGGVNGGAGVSFLLSQNSGARLFIEGRFHHIFTDNSNTDYIPITIGFKW